MPPPSDGRPIASVPSWHIAMPPGGGVHSIGTGTGSATRRSSRPSGSCATSCSAELGILARRVAGRETGSGCGMRTINTGELWLPLENGDLWRAVLLKRIPPTDYRPEYLDREAIFHTELPGAGNGPVIRKLEMARLRRISGPKFRAYIAAHSAAGRHPTAPPPQPALPHVDFGPVALPGPDERGPATAGLRSSGYEEPNTS